MQDIKKWIGAWQKAGSVFLELKKTELQSYDYYQKNLKVLDEMLQYAVDNCQIRLSSGLVEQQRIFMKMKNKT